MKRRVSLLVLAFFLAFVPAASADTIVFTVQIQSGNFACPACQNLFFQGAQNVTSEYASLGSNTSAEDALFTATRSGSSSAFDTSNGFATISATSNSTQLDSVYMQFITFTADSVQFSLFLNITGAQTTDVKFELFGPATTSSTQTFSVDNTNNILVISSNDVINGLRITTLDGNLINDIKQIEVDPHEDQTVVPEPASMLLLGSGLLGAGNVLRRRVKR